MNAIFSPRVYMRSLATRRSKSELSLAIKDAISVVQSAGFDLIIVETSGIGQGDAEIAEICNVSLYVMTSEFGAPSQLEKIDMIDYADLVVINKFERKGSEDALRQVQKQYQRSRQAYDRDFSEMPVYGTIASQFNDPGTNALFAALIEKVNQNTGTTWTTTFSKSAKVEKQNVIIPNDRRYYLREISDTVRNYHKKAQEQVGIARRLFQLEGAIEAVKEKETNSEIITALGALKHETELKLTPESKNILDSWESTTKNTLLNNLLRKSATKKSLLYLNQKAFPGSISRKWRCLSLLNTEKYYAGFTAKMFQASFRLLLECFHLSGKVKIQNGNLLVKEHQIEPIDASIIYPRTIQQNVSVLRSILLLFTGKILTTVLTFSGKLAKVV